MSKCGAYPELKTATRGAIVARKISRLAAAYSRALSGDCTALMALNKVVRSACNCSFPNIKSRPPKHFDGRLFTFGTHLFGFGNVLFISGCLLFTSEGDTDKRDTRQKERERPRFRHSDWTDVKTPSGERAPIAPFAVADVECPVAGNILTSVT